MRKIALFLAVLLLFGCFTGCGNSGVTQEEYDELKEQLDALQKEQEETQQQLEAAQAAVESPEPEEVTEPAPETEQSAEEAPEPEETPKPEQSPESEQSAEESPEPEEPDEDSGKTDASETEIRGGTNQADAVLVPLNTNMHGTLHDAQNMYFSFHTGPDKGNSYQFTVVDKTPVDVRIGFYIFDELGTELGDGSAYSDGIAATITVEDLSPDTDYYIRLITQSPTSSGTRSETVDFALMIRNADAQSEGVSTTNSLLNAVVPPDDVESIVVGTNQDDSALIPTDVTVSGTLKDALGGWFAFATDSSAESSYMVSVINKSVEDPRIGFYVFDELGTEIDDESAYNDGITKTLVLDGLSPDTVYYIRLIAQSPTSSGTRSETIEYDLTIRRQNNAPEDNTATMETKEDVVFEVPFELNETQVRFVGDEATFVDKNEAKEALTPVAEIILAHPDHPILIAGTTATVGTQAECLELSGLRAEAVKDLLVKEFGVPAEQLITIGLGYEADPFVRGRDRDSNGNQIETEAAKNRRVVVLDAESEIARQILGN